MILHRDGIGTLISRDFRERTRKSSSRETLAPSRYILLLLQHLMGVGGIDNAAFEASTASQIMWPSAKMNYILYTMGSFSPECWVLCTLRPADTTDTICIPRQVSSAAAAAAAAAAVLSARDSLWPYPPVILAFWTLSEHDTPYWVL